MTSPKTVSQPVFGINFIRNPWSDRLRRAGLIALIGYILICTLIAALMLLWSIVLVGRIAVSSVMNYSGKAQVVDTGPFESIGAIATQMENELEALDAALVRLKSRPGMGRKLSGLTKTLPPRTWISNLKWDGAAKELTIDAVYVIDPMASGTMPERDWIAALKADPQFSHGLKSIRSGGSSRKRAGVSDLHSFNMVAGW